MKRQEKVESGLLLNQVTEMCKQSLPTKRLLRRLGLTSVLVASVTAAWAGDVIFQYDSLGRVTQIVHGDGSSTVYQYDKAGNRIQVNRFTPPTGGVVTINVTSSANLRALANASGYSGVSGVSYQFVVPAGVTVTGAPGLYTSMYTANSGSTAIETGNWPAGVNLTLVVNGNVYGGGGDGSAGSCYGSQMVQNAGSGGHGINVSAPITITVNGTVAGGGGGGGGAYAVQDGMYWYCGGGGGGGAPNGAGTGGTPYNGNAGSPSAGGDGGMGDDWWFGWTVGGRGGDLGQDGEASGGANGGGSGGAAGQSIVTNGQPVTINGSGSY